MICLFALLAACKGPAPVDGKTPLERETYGVPQPGAEPEAKAKVETGGTVPTCVVEWEMSSGVSVLAEQRRKGPASSDFFTSYPAETIDRKTQAPIEGVSRFTLGGEPMVFLSIDKRSVVIDARFSATLTAVDITRLAVGAREVLGKLATLGRTMPPRELLELLVRADVVRTYAHIGSQICLDRETSEAGAYRADVSGKHTYFTSKKHVTPFAFTFERASDGTMSVTGRAAK